MVGSSGFRRIARAKCSIATSGLPSHTLSQPLEGWVQEPALPSPVPGKNLGLGSMTGEGVMAGGTAVASVRGAPVETGPPCIVSAFSAADDRAPRDENITTTAATGSRPPSRMTLELMATPCSAELR